MTAAPELLELIEQAIHRNGFTSAAQLDAAMGTENKVYQWRKGKFLPSDDLVERLADLAGRDRQEVLALLKAIDAERHNQAAAVTWRAIQKRLSGAAAAVPMLLALMPGFGSQPTHGQEPKVGAGVYYGKRRRFLWWPKLTISDSCFAVAAHA